MSEFYVMWIDQDGEAQYSNEKNARMVVGKIKILLDHKIAFPTRRGCMIEIHEGRLIPRDTHVTPPKASEAKEGKT
jgi:hypothetical protein